MVYPGFALSHRTHDEKFYEVIPQRWNLLEVNRRRLAWERVYNAVRPHQAPACATLPVALPVRIWGAFRV